MKTLLFIGLCTFSFGTFAQTDSKPAAKKETKADKAPIEFKTMVIERNDIPYDSKEPFAFEFKNTGSEPIMITNVATSCGCTKAAQPTEPVKKGKSDKIIVNYDTKRVGPFTKTITVSTNVSTEPIILTIKGTVLPAPVEPADGTTPATPAEPAHNHNH